MSAAAPRPTVSALMHGLIDYAGLFPPAKLDLDTAIKNFASFLDSDDRWMLSKFIIPASRLMELNTYASLFEKNKPFHFSVTGKPSETVESFEAHIVQDLEKIRSFKLELDYLVSPDLFEVRLPVEDTQDDGDLEALLAWVDRSKAERGLSHLQIFYEISWQGNWATDSKRGAAALERFNAQRNPAHPEAGLKLRCGGVDPADVPSPEVVASFLYLAAQHDLPFKATAGLHHPIRHFREEYGGWMHGFVNLFIAGILARRHQLSVDELTTIISESNAAAFLFEEDQIGYKAWSVPLHAFEAERQQAMISYGSCSFDEPREDMQDLNLLPRT
ncbi:hypothetical protein KQI63_01855 [bacterium]|nr:hypothetical protein [bacterium]